MIFILLIKINLYYYDFINILIIYIYLTVKFNVNNFSLIQNNG